MKKLVQPFLYVLLGFFLCFMVVQFFLIRENEMQRESLNRLGNLQIQFNEFRAQAIGTHADSSANQAAIQGIYKLLDRAEAETEELMELGQMVYLFTLAAAIVFLSIIFFLGYNQLKSFLYLRLGTDMKARLNVKLEENDLYNKGVNAVLAKNYSGAVEVLSKLIDAKEKDNETDVAALCYRGFAYNEMKEYEKAEKDLALALEKEPDNPAALRNMGYTLANRKKYREAKELLEKSVLKNPYDATAYTILGSTLNKMGKYFAETKEEAADYYNQAIENFNKAIKSDTSYANPYCNKTESLLMLAVLEEQSEKKRSGYIKEANTCLENALALRPNYDKANKLIDILLAVERKGFALPLPSFFQSVERLKA